MGIYIPITDYSAVADWKPSQAQNGSYNPGFSAQILSSQSTVNRNPFSNLMTPQANSFAMLQPYGSNPWGLTQNFSNAVYPPQPQVNDWAPNPYLEASYFVSSSRRRKAPAPAPASAPAPAPAPAPVPPPPPPPPVVRTWRTIDSATIIGGKNIGNEEAQRLINAINNQNGTGYSVVQLQQRASIKNIDSVNDLQHLQQAAQAIFEGR